MAAELRRNGRVVEGAGLENLYTRKGIVSSNLTSSAKKQSEFYRSLFAFVTVFSRFEQKIFSAKNNTNTPPCSEMFFPLCYAHYD